MHVAEVDQNWLLQFIVLALVAAIGFLYLLASKYFALHSNSSSQFSPDCKNMAAGAADSCAVCGSPTKKQCSGCKKVKYCSESCQTSHWKSEHKKNCKDLQSFSKANHTSSISELSQRKPSVLHVGESSKIIKQPNKILFPYEEFVRFFHWDKPGYVPCGLINCGNTCFANAVLQCLGYTRPLVAYLLEKGHKKECQMDNWCFLCEFQTHVRRASQSFTPFSPINILSRLHYIGGSFGCGEQEDAHEFMRYAIGAMQSACLDEFGGENLVHPSYQETTLIQHIFGGRLHSRVICSQCYNISDQFENMMDLTVEIHGDAGSLEECLEQFTAKEQLHGDNMYKCDNCNAYVMAWKRLSIHQAPNILTIALKRFQSGRYGKLNKRVTFPETLDLSSYMSNSEDGNDVYRLYAVIVHLDVLNASYYGHYICYVKDFCGHWYRIDDWQVEYVDLDEVLSQGAYMLLYSRIRARPSCLLPAEPMKKQENGNVKIRVVESSPMQPSEFLSAAECVDGPVDSGPSISANCSGLVDINHEKDLSSTVNAEDARGDIDMVTCEADDDNFKDVVNEIWGKKRDTEGLLRVSTEECSGAKNSICEKSCESASTSFTDKGTMQADDVNFQDVVNEIWGKKRDAEGLLRVSIEESSGAKNCMSEESCEAASTSFTDKSTMQADDVNFKEVANEIWRKKRDAEGLLRVSTEESSGAKNSMCEESSEAASTSFTDKGTMQADDVNFKDVANEIWAKKRDAEVSLRVSTEESSGAKNCMREESTSSTSMRDDNETKGASKILNLESSRPKVKLIFRPGFLDKQPRKVVNKQEDRVSSAGSRKISPQNKRASAVMRPIFAPGFLVRPPRKVISRHSTQTENS